MPQTEPAIANYDDHTAEEIKQRLRKLSQADLSKLEAYETKGQARSTVLEAIAALRTDAPWSGYDELEVEEVNDALKQRDGKAAGRVLDYERHHKGRVTVMEFAKRRRDDSDGSLGPGPSAGAKDAPQAGQRSQPSKSSSSPKRVGGKSTSAPSQSDSTSKSASRPTSSRSSAQPTESSEGSRPRSQSSSSSSRPKRQTNRGSAASSRREAKSSSSSPSTGRFAKGAATGKQAKTTSRPGAARSSGSQQTKVSQSGRSRSQSTGAGKPQADPREVALAKIRQRATQALRSGEARTNTLTRDAQRAVGSKAKDTQRALGSAAKDSRDAVGTGVKDTGQAVQAAAGKAKAPALVGAATLAALGGGLALGRGSKIKPRKRKRVLGVPVPKRTAFGKATQQVSKAVDRAGSAGKQVSEWSDGLQELRQKIADGKSAASKLSGGKSPV